MVLPTRTPPDPALLVHEIDPSYAERLEADAERYAQLDQHSGWRRAGICLLIAAAVVAIGVAGFRYETDTRWAPMRNVKAPVWVTVTPQR
jgi:hypothetical protein